MLFEINERRNDGPAQISEKGRRENRANGKSRRVCLKWWNSSANKTELRGWIRKRKALETKRGNSQECHWGKNGRITSPCWTFKPEARGEEPPHSKKKLTGITTPLPLFKRGRGIKVGPKKTP